MNNMTRVYTLQHTIDDYDTEPKFLGVYTTRSEAEAAIERYRHREGFRIHLKGFHIDEYELNKDHWESGFAEA